MEILSEKITYCLTNFSLFLIIILTITGTILSFNGIKESSLFLFIFGASLFTLLIILLFFGCPEDHQTFLNKPNKIIRIVEITDNSLWKEIATKYTIKEKLYENKEIYTIIGDYNV